MGSLPPVVDGGKEKRKGQGRDRETIPPFHSPEQAPTRVPQLNPSSERKNKHLFGANSMVIRVIVLYLATGCCHGYFKQFVVINGLE